MQCQTLLSGKSKKKVKNVVLKFLSTYRALMNTLPISNGNKQCNRTQSTAIF